MTMQDGEGTTVATDETTAAPVAPMPTEETNTEAAPAAEPAATPEVAA